MMKKKQWNLALLAALVLTAGTMPHVNGEEITIVDNKTGPDYVDVIPDSYTAFSPGDIYSSGISDNKLSISDSRFTNVSMIGQDLYYTQEPVNANNQMTIKNSIIDENVTGISVHAGGTDTSNLSMYITDTSINGNITGVSTLAYNGGSNVQLKNIRVILDGNTKAGSEEYPSKIVLGYMNPNVYDVFRTYKIEESSLILKGKTDVSHADLWAYQLTKETEQFMHSNNRLILDGWCGGVRSLHNFDAIQFKNLNWENDSVALNITDAENNGELSGTSINVENLVLANGTHVRAGDKMTFIQSNRDTGLSLDKVNVTEDASFSQGVATVGELEMKLEGETNNLVGEIKGVGLNPQTTVIAENRTAAAAFLNQGADIAADSLDLLGLDYKYGLRTFGAVYGNRSTYDAAGDMKLNGWSEIVGLGNVHRKGDGELSWGIFYENGTGNYRTWNEFNNEMFRGDGSLLYNGGGATLRYKQDDGWYYEASVRAGTLSASMDNAVKDGNGNSYGFDSDSTYWGVHAGVGKVIETGRGEWNVYGKYFHTDIDGDSFTIDGDCFEFDSLTSDRLRLGARYTADKAKQWSMYYGLAWEYEFSGDSHMKAGQWDAPEQSLGGSTGILEIGTVWQPDDSPWQANINLKGYAGEREGMSGMVQLAYTF